VWKGGLSLFDGQGAEASPAEVAASAPKSVRKTSGKSTDRTSRGKSALRCHSERSEESLFDLRTRENEERFFASLRMTMFLIFPQPIKPAPREPHIVMRKIHDRAPPCTAVSVHRHL
jgi:hypothetical protein